MLQVGKEILKKRVRAANYLTVAQLFLQKNFLLEAPLESDDIKPRLLGHWGTCPGINLAYACLKNFYQNDENFSFIIGPGHGFPALNANLFIDGELEKVDDRLHRDERGIETLCKLFSWPSDDAFPSHASPLTPGVIVEGGELGYALATAYGYVLGHKNRTAAVLIGDGEFETATTLASLNLNKILSGKNNGRVLPILHLNGYKISAPTIAGRKSERELNELLRGFGFTPLTVRGDNPDADEAIDYAISDFNVALVKVEELFKSGEHPFIIMKTDKGLTGPEVVNDQKIRGNFLAHQIPLKNPKIDERELRLLENWLKSYRFDELFDKEKGFIYV